MSVSGSQSSLVASEGNMSNINVDQGEVSDQQENRQKKLTEKGLGYAIEMTRNSYKGKVSEWKRFHGRIYLNIFSPNKIWWVKIYLNIFSHPKIGWRKYI